MGPANQQAERQSPRHGGSPWRREASHCCGAATHATAREIEVLIAACCGSSADDIGKELFMSARTAREYLTRWHRRLGARNRAELVARSIHAGLVDVASWPPQSTGSKCVPYPDDITAR